MEINSYIRFVWKEYINGPTDVICNRKSFSYHFIRGGAGLSVIENVAEILQTFQLYKISRIGCQVNYPLSLRH